MHWCAYSKTFTYSITGVSIFWKSRLSPHPLAEGKKETTILGSTVKARDSGKSLG